MFNMLTRKNEMMAEIGQRDNAIATLESKLDAVHSMAVINYPRWTYS